ncbi:MAG TPA: SsgA family sporulation/cell division regulator [Pseudonocardiaceae bacterium]|nr:SsgA family sporulation/cell division regulator [Pseudonocardiaceae bacterium]
MTTIHHEQVAALLAAAGSDAVTPVTTRWTYESTEPYQLTVAFATERGRWVEWVFARDLLIDGMSEPTGDGDLRVRLDEEDPELLVLEIYAPSGSAIFSLELDDVEEFLARTLDVVPAGAESTHFDIDRLLAELTAG